MEEMEAEARGGVVRGVAVKVVVAKVVARVVGWSCAWLKVRLAWPWAGP